MEGTTNFEKDNAVEEGTTDVKKDNAVEDEASTCIHRYNIANTYVTGFERTRLPRTQQEDTLFTITW